MIDLSSNIDRVLLGVIAGGQIIRWIDTWVHRTDKVEDRLTQGDKSFAELERDHEELQRKVDAVNKAGSDRHDLHQKRLGEFELRMDRILAEHTRDILDLQRRNARVLERLAIWITIVRRRTHSIGGFLNKLVLYLTLAERGERGKLGVFEFSDEPLDIEDDPSTPV